ncbi:Chromodomain-helicase-DNA-binding protein 1-like [Mizuhopecten yessoensis]|uniref:Chromodomain-helicase-DNA-binding protein 1-like n=1 Tax=Mizuhopecten yessoensis TaxID=6573 RepID=A0A210PIP9_MIZYE|nr:Chromodomain-helicase-DNA-binding protein 1-like [Mizuhopecten yessoensis]
MHDMSSDSDGECSKEIQRKYIDSNDKLKDFGWTDLPLRPYQLTGVNWLIECYQKGHGAILGDEMGLGKTCQTIAFLAYIDSRAKKWHPNLIICPRSILENWVAELTKFAPEIKVKSYVGNKDERNALAKELRTQVKAGRQPFSVLVTTYELCLKDAELNGFLASQDWRAVVVDEAHRLKNSESLLYTTLKQWSTRHRVLLTGTPVQNNLEELYSLLSFVCPSSFRLSGVEKFLRKFKDIERSKGVSELHALLQPYLLRRTKEGVLKDLPKKSEVVLYHGISKLQKKVYKAILTKDLSVFQTRGNYPGGGGGTPRLMNILMQLRKCVNHPYLFDGVEPEPFLLGEHLVEASGKLVLIDKLLSHLKQTGHKVLLFSQMTHMLDIIQDYLGYRDYTYERLDGSVRGEERFLAVQNFNKNEETFIFLLSTRAGGQGLNLVAADTVIFVDSDFNPQNDLQAAARAHRIGQVRPVKIMRLIGRNTVEEIILRRAEDKLHLTEKVIEEGQFTLGAKSLITNDKVGLQDILKFGVDTLLDDNDTDETDVDFTQILGPSVNGEWQPEEEPEVKTSQSAVLEEAPSSMYEFEGTDYSKEPSAEDIKAFEKLLAVEKQVLDEEYTAERSSRGKATQVLELFPGVKRKPRTPLTAEELEERNAKRKETEERKAKLAEEKKARREDQKRKQREDMWNAAGYISSCVQIESDEEEEENGEDEEEFDLTQEEEDGGVAKNRSISYVSGDVTCPVTGGTQVNVIVHCADDSGSWGRGGLFSAIGRRSSAPQEQYELAGDMGDLALGNCHLIALDDNHTRDGEEDWLALVIAQHRDKRNNLSGIKLSALQQGLKAVHYLAKARKASVHLPRIGHDTPWFNWYGTERLIKKHLTAEGIPTFIYYYPRKQQLLKRKSSEDSDPPAKKKKISTVSFKEEEENKPHTLLDIFHGVTAYLHPFFFNVYTYDADVEVAIGDKTTHVIVHSTCSTEDRKSLVIPDEAVVVYEKWLDDSLKKGRCLPSHGYLVDK